MRRTIRYLLLAALPVAFGTTLLAQGGCVAVAVGSPEKDKGKVETSFSATGIIDLDFWVVFTPGAAKRFEGDHELEVRIYTPKGHLYTSISTPFSADEKSKGASRKLDGYPHGLAVKTFEQVGFESTAHPAIGVRMPVAGSMIVSNSIYGTWTAEAFVDKQSIACAKSTSFEIKP